MGTESYMNQQKHSSLKWVLQKAKMIKWGLVTITVLGVLYSLLGVGFAMASKSVLDVATGQAQGGLVQVCALLGGLLILQLLIQVAMSMLDVRLKGKLEIYCKKSLFQTLVTKEWSSISKFHTGDLLNRLTSDLAVITNGVTGILPDLIYFITRIAASFAMLLVLDPLFALLCLLIGPLILVSARLYRKKMKTLHKQCQESDGKTRSFMQEALQNLLVIKSFRGERHIIDHSTTLQNENFRLKIKRNNISILANVLFFIALTAGYYFALGWGAFKIAAGAMTFGTLTAILQLVGQIQMPFESLSALIPQYYSTIASAERIMELEDLPSEPMLENKTRQGAELYGRLEGIRLDGVSFAYGEEPVFDGAELLLKKGEFAAITGSSGIGKSTLLKLLLGIISPKEGSIALRLDNGDMVPVGIGTRGLFAYVPQGNMILSGTIRENIAFAVEHAEETEIIQAARTAEIWEFIQTLPEGLDTVLGEGGLGLSEGQVQRIAIARALLYNAPVLLLDECTSALDEQTEAKVLRNLKALDAKTCIIISHKRAAVECCDTRIIIRNGKIVAERA